MKINLLKYKCVIELDEEAFLYLKKELRVRSFMVNERNEVTCSLYKRKEKLSRLILRYDGPLFVDHIDRNRLNNKKDNLRLVTQSQSNQNRRKSKNSSNYYKGVFKRARENIHGFRITYVAKIFISKTHVHLGTFKTQEEAALAYNEAAIKYHGEYACLNDIKESV